MLAAAFALPIAGAIAQPSQALRQRLQGAIDQIPIVNTHEHTIAEADRLAAPRDPFLLVDHYLVNDMVSAGMPADDVAKLANTSMAIADRWKIFEPWWKRCQFTGYATAFRTALQDLYGVAEIDARGLEHVQQQMAGLQTGFYKQVLLQHAHIAYSVLDDYWNGEPTKPDTELFTLARKFDWFATPRSRKDLDRMAEVTGVQIQSLAQLKQAMEKRIQQNLDVGMVAIKSTIAYQRSLDFPVVSEAVAAKDFVRLAATREPAARPANEADRPFGALEAHMFHHLLAVAEDRRIPIQIHTGMQAGNSNNPAYTRASLLTPCIRRYPNLSFDLFHIGFPWTGDVLALAKMFPNVSVDFCWAWILSPALAKRALREMLGALPYSKILGFGGDYRYVELTYGHARMARRGIAEVLAGMVQEGACSESAAVEMARSMLSEAPARLFPKHRPA